MSNSILDTLNENQRTAATTINEHVRIIAGAGSGKTRVLMAVSYTHLRAHET